MRRASALVAALTLVPLPAAADVTAHYDFGKDQLTVSVDDSGDYRAEVPGKVILLRRSGVDYVVIVHGGTPLVIERQAFLGLAQKMVPGMSSKPSGERRNVRLASAGEEIVAGRRGTSWSVWVENSDGNVIRAVMSADRDLAPVGAVFANVVDAGLQAFGGMLPAANLGERLREVMAKGAPLRLTLGDEVRLRSVSSADVDAALFVLPGPAMDASAFDKAMSAPAAPATPLP